MHTGRTLALVALCLVALGGVAVAQTATVQVQGDRLTVENTAGQVIEGQTSLAEGTRISLRIRSTDSQNPFLLTVETTTGANGSFAATADFSEVEAGTAFQLSVIHDGTTLTEVDGEVVACRAACGATPTATPADTETISGDAFAVRSIVQAQQGQTARIPIGFGDAEAVTLVLGGEEVNYRTAATAHDGNGDGRVVVTFDTAAAAANGTAFGTVADADSIAVVEPGRAVEGGLDPAPYDMDFYRGTATSGQPDAVGTLVIREPLTRTTPPAAATDSPRAGGETADGGTPARTPTVTLDGGQPAGQGLDTTGAAALGLGSLLALAGVALLLGIAR